MESITNMAAPAASPDKTLGAMTRALSRLKQMIISGDLSPGVQIRQDEMAEQLQISRVPLREAMNVLADQGLLLHRPHQGYFVTKRAVGEYAQIRRMLHLLEGELMATVRWPDEGTLATLQALNEEMRDRSRRVDLRALIEVNRQFHFRVFSLSPNGLIVEEVRRLWTMIEPSMWKKFERADDRERTLEEHQRMIEALAAHDRTRCIAELEQHRYSSEYGLPLELPGVQAEPPRSSAG